MTRVRLGGWLVTGWVLLVPRSSAEDIGIDYFEGREHHFVLSTGDEFPGAKGRLLLDRIEQRGCVRLDADFSDGGGYVAMGAQFPIPVAPTAVRFRAKSLRLSKVTVRLIDGSGQAHQQMLGLGAGAAWEELRLTEFTSGDGGLHWGGANDGQWHNPATRIELILEKNQVSGEDKTASLWIDEVVAEGRAIEPLRMEFVAKQLGHIFIEGEPVEIGIETSASEVEWTVRDWRNLIHSKGITRVDRGEARLNLNLPGSGYFVLEARVKGDGGDDLVKSTSLAQLPPVNLDGMPESAFGVCTHFAQGWDVEIVPLIARAGIKHVRDELYWEAIEPDKGRYSMPARFERYLDELRRNHLAAVIPLTFGNPHYDHGQTPHTIDGLAAYARYGQEVLRLRPEIDSVEIWNEYNGSFCNGPALEDRSLTYSRMLAGSYVSLKKEKHSVRVVGVSSAGMPWPYLEKLFQHEALRFLDVVSVHPYRYDEAPEGMEHEIERLSDLIRQNSSGVAKKIWATEYGWGTLTAKSEGDVEISEMDQAKFLVRGHTLLLAGGVERAFWYLFQDTSAFPEMGLIQAENHAPKPAFVSYATLIRQLSGAHFVERETAGPGIYCLRFQDAEANAVRVLWSIHPRSLRVIVPQHGSVVLTDLMGQAQRPVHGELVVEVNDAPVYLRGPVEGLPVFGTHELEDSNLLLADSEAEFSDTQGRNGWSYGYESHGEFAEFKQHRVTDWTREWFDDGLPWISISPADQHPSARDGSGVAVVRRWRSTQTGTASIWIEAKLGNGQGDGVTVCMRQDGRVVFSQKMGGGVAPRRFQHLYTINLNYGSTLDFVVDPGDGTDTNFDGTILKVKISEVNP